MKTAQGSTEEDLFPISPTDLIIGMPPLGSVARVSWTGTRTEFWITRLTSGATTDNEADVRRHARAGHDGIGSNNYDFKIFFYF